MLGVGVLWRWGAAGPPPVGGSEGGNEGRCEDTAGEGGVEDDPEGGGEGGGEEQDEAAEVTSRPARATPCTVAWSVSCSSRMRKSRNTSARRANRPSVCARGGGWCSTNQELTPGSRSMPRA